MRGGLLNRPVELILLDDQSSEEEARRHYRHFIEDSPVDLVLSPFGTPLTLAAFEISERSGYVMLASAASADILFNRGYHRLFGVYAPANRYFIGLVDLMARRGISVSEVINLNTIVGEYQNGLEYKRHAKNHPGIHLDIHLNKALFNISGSMVHLSKTLMNLVSNAAEAMPVGGTIGVATENRYVDYPIGNYDAVPEGDYAVLQVSDQGTGIAKADLDHIFELFFT